MAEMLALESRIARISRMFSSCNENCYTQQNRPKQVAASVGSRSFNKAHYTIDLPPRLKMQRKCLEISAMENGPFVDDLTIWRFPKIGLPPNHPFVDGILPQQKPSIYRGTPMTTETSISLSITTNHDLSSLTIIKPP